MKIICTRDNLRRGITHCERSAGKNPSLPILGNIMLEAEKGLLKISATNLETGVISYVRAKVEKEGKTTVPAGLLAGLVHNLKDDQLSIEEDGQMLKIGSVNFESKIRTIPAEEFPLIPKVEKGETIKIPGRYFGEAIRRVSPALATLETKLELTGICLTIRKDELKIAATDGYRLAEKIIKTANKGIAEETIIIVPGRGMGEIEKIFGEEGREVTLTSSENQIAFQNEDVYFVSRLIEGQYPDYKQIIPSEFKAKAKFDKEEMLSSLRLAGIFSVAQTKDVKIKLEDDKISLHATSGELGEHHASIPADVEGEKLEVTFNYQFLQDGLNCIGEDEILFSLNGSEGPSLMRGIDKKTKGEVSDFFYIVMPIRQ
ncbi:MAG: DNA polymerase III subunit beta [Candidatus Moranbacteria bacterium]|nr:DNA polymerase III subunit beta [Candidatus Moranbacteria bacterium]